MAKKVPNRAVRCYLCDHEFEIPRDAITTSCPGCFKRVQIEDIIVKTAQGNTVLGTCGRLVVQARASLVAKKVRAIEGIEIHGTVDAALDSEGMVTVGATGRWKGDCRAKGIVVEPGGVITGGYFEIGPGAGPRRAERHAEEDEPAKDAAAESKPAARRATGSRASKVGDGDATKSAGAGGAGENGSAGTSSTGGVPTRRHVGSSSTRRGEPPRTLPS